MQRYRNPGWQIATETTFFLWWCLTYVGLLYENCFTLLVPRILR